ncbi:TAP-like protein-domain-containing protein [Earliella scabrosa]|nr:TAP-like protein-domain-containing protein [Earliella scabrosa]
MTPRSLLSIGASLSLALHTQIHYANAASIKASRQTPPDSSIQWGPCDPSIVPNPTLSCGFLEVPIDYHDRSVGTGRLAVVKANATGERVGSLLMNPGGPGVSGLQELSRLAPQLLSMAGGSYDIVSWDPRGVGSLTVPGELYCFDSIEEYNALFQGTIEEHDIHRLLAQADSMQQTYEEAVRRCQERENAKYLKYMGTAATARDVVALADAVDGKGAPVNFIGYSWGTVLGTWLEQRVGKIIVDGVVDAVSMSNQEIIVGWSEHMQDADRVYEGLVTGCALAGPEGCAIAEAGHSPADVHATLRNLLKVAHDATIADPAVPLTSGMLRTSLFRISYWPSQWLALTNRRLPEIIGAVQAEAGAGVRANTTKRDMVLPRMFFERAETETPSFSTPAIMCGDGIDASGTVTMRSVFEDIIATSRDVSHFRLRLMRRAVGSQWPFASYWCSVWQERAVERYHGPFNKTLANRILVVGNTHDPITPFHGAKTLADLLGDQAAFVRVNGFGHTTIDNPSACLADIVKTFMNNGTLPEGGETVCEVDDAFELWPGVNTRMIMGNMHDGRWPCVLIHTLLC